MATLPGNLIADKYRVERVLGSGGMGIVLACKHAQLDQLVAIKIMRSQAQDVFHNPAERFLREARALVRLQGEHVAGVLDVGTLDDGRPYLVMEYLDGMSLAELLEAHGALSVVDAVDLTLQACAAIAEAHDQGIIHRDIKPANLFLTRRPDGSPVLKVLDFGISRYRDCDEPDDVTATGKHVGGVGSPAYMSPEQMRSVRLADERSDVWSLGVVLYQLLCGLAPFRGGSAAEIAAMVTSREAQPLLEMAPWLPSGLEMIVRRCLAKKPDDRYNSITSLASELTRYASDQGRALADSPHIAVRWRVLPRATTHDDSAGDTGSYEESFDSSSVEIMPPEALDVTSVLSMRPEQPVAISETVAKSLVGIMPARARSSADPLAETVAAGLAHRPFDPDATELATLPRPRRQRHRRLVAVLGVIALVLVIAGLVSLADWSQPSLAPAGSHAEGARDDPGASQSAVSTEQPGEATEVIDGDVAGPSEPRRATRAGSPDASSDDPGAAESREARRGDSRITPRSRRATRAERRRARAEKKKTRESRRDRKRDARRAAREKARKENEQGRQQASEKTPPQTRKSSSVKKTADPFGTPD